MKNFRWTRLMLALLSLSWSCVHSRSIDTNVTKTHSPEEAITSLPEFSQQKQTKVVPGNVVEAIAQNIVAAAVAQAVGTEIEAEVKKEVEEEITKDFLINIPQQSQGSPLLDFEGGIGDNENGVRDTRSVGLVGNIFGGGQAQGRSGPNRQLAYNRQLRQWIVYQKRQIAKYNATEGGNYTTPFPMLPPPPPEEEENELTTQRPGGFLGNLIKAKLQLVPNLFRAGQSFFQEVGPQLQNWRLGGGGGGGGGAGLIRGLLGGNRGGSSSSSIRRGSSSYGGSGGGSAYSGPSDLRPFSLSSSSGSSVASSSASTDADESSTYKITLG